MILSALLPLAPNSKRNKIVFEELNFPSVMYVYEAHARAHGLRIERVKSDDGITIPLERMLAAIDEETLLVPISHVLFKSGFLQDAKAITERAHKVGAMVVLDCYQSAGTVPFSVKELECRLRHRRFGEVAVRRAGRGLSVCAARFDRSA